ncbi:fimbria/pilus outer membrane usher protein, partial [Escherichia coli]|nr:fimbria/pilus outer membrane usher protein [Escherichia coli]
AFRLSQLCSLSADITAAHTTLNNDDTHNGQSYRVQYSKDFQTTDTSFTLAWMPGEQGQQALLAWFNEGDTRAYKIRFPNGTVDVFRGWVSSIGKAVTAKEVITRTVKVTNVGRPSMAEDHSTVTAATGMTVTPASTSVVKGQSTTLTVAFQPEGATDKSFRAVSADKT